MELRTLLKVWLLFLFLFPIASHAGSLRIGPEYSFSTQHKVKNLNTSHKGTLYGLTVDYLFSDSSGGGLDGYASSDPGGGGSLFSSGNYFWGLGLNYFNYQAEEGSRGTDDLVTLAEFDLNFFSMNLLLGAAFSSVKIEIPLGFAISQESNSLNSGDEKYGYSVGMNVRYQFYGRWALGFGYQQFEFFNGKNASTGQSGSLANPISLSIVKAMLTYTWSLESSGGLSYD